MRINQIIAMLPNMAEQPLKLEELINAPNFDPERLGGKFWYEQYLEQRERAQQLEQQLSQLQEAVNKLKQRSSQNSSQPPSQDGYKKANRSKQKGKKRGPKYGHPGNTRNGFGWVDHAIELTVSACPVCGSEVEQVVDGTVARQGD